jgi:hypothetical protein
VSNTKYGEIVVAYSIALLQNIPEEVTRNHGHLRQDLGPPEYIAICSFNKLLQNAISTLTKQNYVVQNENGGLREMLD